MKIHKTTRSILKMELNGLLDDQRHNKKKHKRIEFLVKNNILYGDINYLAIAKPNKISSSLLIQLILEFWDDQYFHNKQLNLAIFEGKDISIKNAESIGYNNLFIPKIGEK